MPIPQSLGHDVSCSVVQLHGCLPRAAFTNLIVCSQVVEGNA